MNLIKDVHSCRQSFFSIDFPTFIGVVVVLIFYLYSDWVKGKLGTEVEGNNSPFNNIQYKDSLYTV